MKHILLKMVLIVPFFILYGIAMAHCQISGRDVSQELDLAENGLITDKSLGVDTGKRFQDFQNSPACELMTMQRI